MPRFEDEVGQNKPIYEGDTVEEITAEMRAHNAQRLDLTEDELRKMPLSEVQARIQQKKAAQSSAWWKFW